MDPEIPTQTPEVVYQDQAYLKSIKMKRLAIILILAIILLVSGVAGYFAVKHYILKEPTPPQSSSPQSTLSRSKPTLTPPTEIGVKTLTLKDCNVNPSSNPLVSRVIPASKETAGDTPAIIILLGNVNSIIPSQDRKTANISLLSFQAEQIHTLKATQQNGLVFDQTLGKEALISDLKAGQLLEVQYNCFPNNPEDKRFKLAQVYIRTAQ